MGWPSIQGGWCPHTRRRETEAHTEGPSHVKTGAETGGVRLPPGTPGIAGSHQKPGEKETDSSSGHREGAHLPAPRTGRADVCAASSVLSRAAGYRRSPGPQTQQGLECRLREAATSQELEDRAPGRPISLQEDSPGPPAPPTPLAPPRSGSGVQQEERPWYSGGSTAGVRLEGGSCRPFENGTS